MTSRVNWEKQGKSSEIVLREEAKRKVLQKEKMGKYYGQVTTKRG